jgi:hypothetical protein
MIDGDGDFIKEHSDLVYYFIRWPAPTRHDDAHDLGVGRNVYPKLWVCVREI